MPYTRKERERRIAKIKRMIERDPECSVAKIARELGVQEKNASSFMRRYGLQTAAMKDAAE